MHETRVRDAEIGGSRSGQPRTRTCTHMQVFAHTKALLPGTLLKAQLSLTPPPTHTFWRKGIALASCGWGMAGVCTSWFQAEVLVCDFLFLLLSPSFFSLLLEECVVTCGRFRILTCYFADCSVLRDSAFKSHLLEQLRTVGKLEPL